jgi:hypothetical protein
VTATSNADTAAAAVAAADAAVASFVTLNMIFNNIVVF